MELSEQGRLTEALESAVIAARLCPDDPRLLCNCGVSFFMLGLHTECLALMRLAAEFLDDELDTLTWEDATLLAVVGLGIVEEDPDIGLKFLRHAVGLDEECGLAHHNLSVALGKLGLNEDALPHARKALALRPMDPDFRIQLATACAFTGLAEESLEHLEVLKRSGQLDEDSRFNLALRYLDADREMEAVELFKQHLAEHPDDACGHGLAGVAYAQMRWDSDARQEQAEALRLGKDRPEVMRLVDEIDEILGKGGGEEDEQKALLAMFVMAALMRRGSRSLL
ncbi:MAG: hypothetical protein ABIJ09_25810 [Pseudomonadota bacterium]